MDEYGTVQWHQTMKQKTASTIFCTKKVEFSLSPANFNIFHWGGKHPLLKDQAFVVKIIPFLPRIACSRQIASCKCILQVCKNPPFSCTVEPAPNWARNIVIWEEFQWRRQIFLSLWSYSRFDNLNWKLQQRVGPSFQNVLNIWILFNVIFWSLLTCCNLLIGGRGV